MKLDTLIISKSTRSSEIITETNLKLTLLDITSSQTCMKKRRTRCSLRWNLKRII